MFGLSVFLGEELEKEAKEYLIKMRAAGFDSIFTSLHIPEENAGQYLSRLKMLGAWADELGMTLTADISKQALEKISVPLEKIQQLKAAGLSGLRIDYGFSNKEIADLTHHFLIALNASTITQKDISELQQHQADFAAVTALHNYYPRPETGLDKRVFAEKNGWLKENGLTVSAFVPGNQTLRGPLFAHLPTLEKQREQHPLAAAIELQKDCFVDNVYIGDPAIHDRTIDQFQKYIQAKTLLFHIKKSNDSPYFSSVLGRHQNRWDPARDVLRSADARLNIKNSIEPGGTSQRKRGSVTIDNRLYGRYMGETQVIINTLPADQKVNVVAEIVPEDLDLLDWCRAGDYFELRKDGFSS